MKTVTYPDYRHSGIGWIGRVPSHWQVKRLKFVSTAVKTGGTPPADGEDYFDDEGINWYTPGDFNEALRLGKASKKVGREAVALGVVRSFPPGCVLLVGIGATLGKVGLAERECSANQQINIIAPDASVDARFLASFLSSCTTQIRLLSHASTLGIINQERTKQVSCVLPPLDEQRAIVRFLDAKTAEIDGLITKKQRLLELLAEQRSALITKAVTKGLNPNAPLKPSGFTWLGDVPVHWEVKRLDLLNDAYRPIMYGIVLPGPSVDDGVPIIKGGDVRPDRLTPVTLSKTTFEIDEAHARSRVRAGDIVYAIRGSYGDAEIVPAALMGANLTQDAARIAPIEDVSTTWLLYALKSEPTRQQLASRSLGATIKGVNIRDLKRAMLPVPPAQEQAAIGQHLATLDGWNERLRNAVELHIERLKEMRSTLITGKRSTSL